MSQEKAQQLATNVQYLFDNMTRVRYSANGLTRDQAVKVISGKVPFSKNTLNWSHTRINFGSFFSAGCRPVINISLEIVGSGHRSRVTMTSLSETTEIDHNGIIVSLSTEVYSSINYNGFIHWTATGY
jgi:hypothetical protein